LNPLVVSLVALAGVLILVLPRRFALVPFVFLAPLIHPEQAVALGALTFSMARVLLVFLWIRVLLRGEFRSLEANTVDKLILAQFAVGTLVFVLLRGTTAALVNRMGWAFDGISLYFLMRWLIRDRKTWERLLTTFAILCVGMGISMFIEHRTGRNFFAVLGGVPETTDFREGAVRSFGPFAHSILAGMFAASLTVLFVSFTWLRGRISLVQVAGILGGILMVVSSASSTPVLACAFGVVGLGLWRIRTKMRMLRWGIVLSLVGLQLVMNNPVWALIARFKIFGGSTGWYRYFLIDNFLQRFPEWWLLGVESTAKWGWGRFGLWDVSNMYVRVGVDGGLITLVLFIAIMVQSYKKVGRTVQNLAGDTRAQKCVWALGACLTAHAFGFFGVNYWDQSIVAWYMLLAVIASSSQIFAAPPVATVAAAAHDYGEDYVLESAPQDQPADDLVLPPAVAWGNAHVRWSS
jgi:hypothetical protein